MQNHTAIGRQGEFLAAYFLESNGIECHHVNRQEADLWCKMPNGTLVPVQVKACSKPTFDPRWNAKTPSYRFFSKKDANRTWFAYVALDVRIVLMFAAHESRHWIKADLVNEDEQSRRVQEFLAAATATT